MKAAVFLERDGILNLCDQSGRHQVVPRRLEEFRVNPAAHGLLSQLKQAGFVLIVATNQPGVVRGHFSRSELDRMHAFLRRQLPLDDILICVDDDPSHPCCKPNPGLFLEAGFKWGLDLDRSFVISDKWPDAKAAHIAGCTSVMVQSPWVGNDHHDFVVNDLPSAVAKILHLHANLFSSLPAAA
jgi:D-glycero-D-manno-heptose 1,7-bisphosphate phosphatase